MEDFPYDKYISTSWTTAKAPKAKSTTLARGALKGKSRAGEESPSRDVKVTLKDLCPEEKAKIGELVKKLAMTKSEKETLEKQRQDELQEMQAKLQSLEQHNKKLARSKQKLATQLEQYMEELSSLHREKAQQEAVKEERPITPIKTVKEEGIQAEAPAAAEDKETQVTEAKVEDLPRPQKASQEVKTLKREIATLSCSLRNFTSSTMSSPFVNSQLPRSRASVQTEDQRPSEPPKPSFKQLFRGESPDEEERFRAVIERSVASSQRAKRFISENGSISDVRETLDKSNYEELQVQNLPYDPRFAQRSEASFPPMMPRVEAPYTQSVARPEVQFSAVAAPGAFSVEPHSAGFSAARGDGALTSSALRAESPLPKPEPPYTRAEVSRAESRKQFISSIPSPSSKHNAHFDPPLCEADLSIMDQVYNESLFDLVEEMEESAKKPREPVERTEEGTELEYSVGSSPWVERDSEDSFEELQRRNQRLKSTVGDVVGRKKGVWRP